MLRQFNTLLLLFAFALSSHSQTLQAIESVEYDPIQNRFFVTNQSSIIAIASDGTLSFFGSGAASYGMEVMGNTLFAIQGAAVRGYDLTSEAEVMSINISGAAFLNGMTNDGANTIYITDFGNNRIIKIDVSDFANPVQEVIVSNTGTTPNGIVFDGANNRLLFANWGSSAAIKAVDLSDNSVSTVVTTPYSNIDGIDEDNEGNYYIAYWGGGPGAGISKYDAAFANAPETITTPAISNPADICYAKEIDTLAIPHSGNVLTFVGFEPIIIDNVNEALEQLPFQMKVHNNPINDNSFISFQLENVMPVKIDLLDQNGRLVKVLMDGTQVNGHHKVMLTRLNLPAGIYYCNFSAANVQQSLKLFVK